MSSLENDRIEEQVYENFVDLVDSDAGIRERIFSLFKPEEVFLIEDSQLVIDEVLIRIFNALWEADAEHMIMDLKGAIYAI